MAASRRSKRQATGNAGEDGPALSPQTGALLELAHDEALHSGDLAEAFARITEAASRALRVERVGIWLYRDGGQTIRCEDLYLGSTGEHVAGTELAAADHPCYFAALEQERVIPAHDAVTDPRTREFAEGYLEPNRISSMLDAPIWLGGGMVGIVCHEHVGPRRIWSTEDQAFAGSMADFVALAMESAERRRAERERRELEAKLAAAQRMESLANLAGGVAHDFNNMLMAVLGNASLALQDLPEGHPARPCVEDVERAALRAAELAKQLLAYSGRGRLVSEQVDLSAIVSEMGRLLESSLSANTRLTMAVDPDMPAVEGDPTQLRQVVLNLIVNASESLGDEEGTVRVTTAVRELRPGELSGPPGQVPLAPGPHACLVVADDGCGMDEATLGRVFDPFYTTKKSGRGLGLAAVLGIVRGHGGTIRAESNEGGGTTFEVWLPLSGSEGVAHAAAAAIDDEPFEGAGTVLVADDDVGVRSVARRILESHGFDVVEARDGREAVAMARELGGRLALVILDLTMPKMGGEEACRAIRSFSPETPVLLSSGYGEPERLADAAGGGPCEFVEKPYRASRLLEVVRAVLTR